MGTLYVVATPIGNLEDLTRRAERVLHEAGVVVAEDTRRARKLLTHLGIRKRLISYHADSPESREDLIVARLHEGDVALICDAGTPGISDPGPELIARVRQEGYAVVPIPGPSALSTALSVVSFARQPVSFIGFLPERRVRRERLVKQAAGAARTLVIYLPPHSAAERLAELLGWLGDLPAALCRELTKLHEEIRETSLADLRAVLEADGVRGEITLVIDTGEAHADGAPDRQELEDAVAQALAAGLAPSKAAAAVARDHGVPRAEAYRVATTLRSTADGDDGSVARGL